MSYFFYRFYVIPTTDNLSKISDPKSLVPSKKTVQQFVSNIYGTKSIMLPPKQDDKTLQCAIEVFYSAPRDTEEMTAEFRIKGWHDPFYVKCSALCKVSGLSKNEINDLEIKGDKAFNELAEKVVNKFETSLIDKKKHLEEIEKTTKKLHAISKSLGSGDFLVTLALLYSYNMSSNRIINLLQDPDFDDRVMLDTLIHIGTQFKVNKQQDGQYVRSEKVKGVKTRYTYIFDEGEICIFAKPIGQGSFAKAKVRHMLFSGEKDAGLIFKGVNVEETVTKNIQNLKKVKGVRNIISNYKCKYKVPTKGGQVKYFLGHELYDGEALKLCGKGIHHALIAIRDVAQALADLHKLGLIHSDVKLANIYFKGDLKQPKCAIRGILGDVGCLTEKGAYAGLTLAYCAPEVLKPYMTCIKNPVRETKLNLDASITDKFDSFSLGIAIFQLITSKDTMYDGKDFPMATDCRQIETTLKLAIKGLKESLSKLSKEGRSEAFLKIDMLYVVKGLLQLDPTNRDTCATAAKRLELLVNKYHIEEQKV